MNSLTPSERQEVGDLHRAHDRGLISYVDFKKAIVDLHVISSKQLDEFFITRHGYHRNDQLLSFIRLLSKKYKLAILSNAGSSWVTDTLLSPDEVALFDVVVLSYQVGLLKPDPAIYKLALDKLAISPEQAVMIDDIESYCQAAVMLGMQSILYTNFVQFKQELDRILTDTNQ